MITTILIGNMICHRRSRCINTARHLAFTKTLHNVTLPAIVHTGNVFYNSITV